jgi:surfeit locus 1 family protein
MHQQTPLPKIKSESSLSRISLLLLTFLFICLFTSLGFWQLSRAQQKKILLKSFAEKTKTTLPVKNMNSTTDLRFYRAKLEGSFDNQHTFLLDNKIFHGKVGYAVYTPFNAKGLKAPILVNRGFVPMGVNRQTLPVINSIEGNVNFEGMLNLPPAYVSLGPILEPGSNHWPLRVEFINLEEMTQLMGVDHALFPYIISLEPTSQFAYPIEWQIVTMGPERHLGYAVQWFALALTLLILSVVLSRSQR